MIDARKAKLAFKYWIAAEFQLSNRSEELDNLMASLRLAIFEYEEYSRAECILDGMSQRFNCEKLSPFL
jgi:hypothetical protein